MNRRPVLPPVAAASLLTILAALPVLAAGPFLTGSPDDLLSSITRWTADESTRVPGAGDITNVTGGISDIAGNVTLTAGARIITSGAGSVTTFLDTVRHNGTEIFTGADASTVFFGTQSGAGAHTGSGTVRFSGEVRPGNSPAIVVYSPYIIFLPSNTLTMEIGGLTPGPGTPVDNGYDKLLFIRQASPQVTWGGALVIDLINGFVPSAGDAFDIFDFTPGSYTGAFSSITVADHGLLPPGLAFNFDELYVTGIIRVVSVPSLTFAQWTVEAGIPGALPAGDHDQDGDDNATEYALALFPPVPGTAGPTGGLHTYGDGDRLRLLFTRPLDRSDVTLRVQASSDLAVWEDLAVSVNSAAFTGPGFVSENRAHALSDPGLVEVRDVVTTSAGARRQMRLQISVAP